MHSLDELQFYKNNKIYLVASSKDNIKAGKSKPKCDNPKVKKDFGWKKKHDGNWIEFTDAELLNAEGWLINLERSKIVDVDFDHPSAYAFQHLLPQDTFKIGKEIDGKIQTTHYYYRSEYARAKEYSLGLTEEESKTQKDISVETITNTLSLCHGAGRKYIQKIPPKQLDQQQTITLEKTISDIALLSGLKFRAPKVSGKSNDYYFKLSRVLGSQSKDIEWGTNILKELCIAHKGREKISDDTELWETYWEDEYKSMFEDAVNYIKENNETFDASFLLAHVNKYEPDVKHLPFLKSKPKSKKRMVGFNYTDFIMRKYSPLIYKINPILRHPSDNMIFGEEGKGKSWIAMQLCISLTTGTDFLHYKFNKDEKPLPCMYIDTELPGTDVQKRFDQLNADMFDSDPEKIGVCRDNLHIYSFVDQEDGDFNSYDTEEGREILEEEIKWFAKEKGQMPCVFIDNITNYTSGEFEEKEGSCWKGIILWEKKMRGLGVSFVKVHHATKAPYKKTASGSNFNSRNLDLSMHVQELDEANTIDTFEGLQCKVSFSKGRNVKGTKDGKPFIARLPLYSSRWQTSHRFFKNDNEKHIFTLLDAGERWNDKSDKKLERDKWKVDRSTYFNHKAMWEKLNNNNKEKQNGKQSKDNT